MSLQSQYIGEGQFNSFWMYEKSNKERSFKLYQRKEDGSAVLIVAVEALF